MYLFLYTMLLAGGGALAHFKGYYSTRNLFVRDAPLIEGKQLVECPVCNNTSWIHLSDTCDINLDGKIYKKCKFGVYENEACGDRHDCKRGPGEKCSSIVNRKMYDLRCASGYHCDEFQQVCVGGSKIPHPVNTYYLNPMSYSGSDNQRSIDLYNSRERRSEPYPFLRLIET